MPDAVALAMVEALPAVAPTVGWQTIGALSLARSGAAISADDTRIYISHGSVSGGVTTGSATFTPGTGFVGGPQASVSRTGVAGAWCNGKHYAIGGQNASNQQSAAVEAYTPAGTNGASGVWSSLAVLPNNTSYGSAASIGNSVYFAGGSNSSGTSALLYRYDTTNNTWSTLASMPAARTQGAMVAVGSKLYYLGGRDSGGTPRIDIYAFDTASGSWSVFASPSGVSGGPGVAAAIGINLYWIVDGNTVVRVFDLNAAGASSLTTEVPTAHGNFPGLVASGQSLYLVSGTGTANVDRLNLGAGTSYTAAVLGVKSLLNPLLAGVAGGLPNTPPTDTTGKAVYAQTVQTLRALAAIS